MDEAVLDNIEGNPASDLPLHAGCYVPDDGVELVAFDGDDWAIHFPAEREWALDVPNQQRFPWPGWHRVTMKPMDVLREFPRIDTCAKALDFASRYGPTWACALHPFPCLWRGNNWPDVHGGRHRWGNVEPVGWWLDAATMLRWVLAAAGRLRAEMRLTDQDWRDVGLSPQDRSTGSLKTDGYYVASFVNGCLNNYGVGLHLNLSLEVEFNSGLGFLPAAWQQAVVVIGAGHALAICDGCSMPYIRGTRRPKTGQRNWCSQCQELRKRPKAASGLGLRPPL